MAVFIITNQKALIRHNVHHNQLVIFLLKNVFFFIQMLIHASIPLQYCMAIHFHIVSDKKWNGYFSSGHLTISTLSYLKIMTFYYLKSILVLRNHLWIHFNYNVKHSRISKFINKLNSLTMLTFSVIFSSSLFERDIIMVYMYRRTLLLSGKCNVGSHIKRSTDLAIKEKMNTQVPVCFLVFWKMI